jgi:flagellar hook-associated protein 2
MAGSLALSGLASGVDTSAIIQQLMAIESQGKTRLTNKQSQSQAREAGIKDVQAKLTALKTAADALTAPSTWKSAQTAESSDATRVSATLLGGTAGAGATTINVKSLAASAQHAYEYDPATTGDITIDGVTVKLAADTSIQDAAAKINAAGTKVSATVVHDDINNRDVLALAAKSTGAASEFTVTGPTLIANSRWDRTGADASYTVNGDNAHVYTSATNVVENAIPGIRLTLKATTGSDVTITVGSPATDQDTVKSKIQAYVSAYNALIDTVNAKSTEKTVPKASTTSDLTKGMLFGDSGLSSMVSRLRNMTLNGLDTPTDGSPAPEASWDSFADLGISTGKASGTTSQDAKLGKLQIDDAKLSDLLASNPEKVKTLLGALTKQVGAYVDGQNKVLGGRVTSADDEQKALTEQMRVMDDQLSLKQKRLEAQFAAMESALSQSQSQQQWLTGQLAALNG